MAKGCVCPPSGKSKGKVSKGGKLGKGNSSGDKKIKRKGHPANMFILYFLDMWRQYGGNMYCVAKECGRKWWTLPQSVKDKYKRQYCARCKSCKSCTRPSKGGSSSKGRVSKGKRC